MLTARELNSFAKQAAEVVAREADCAAFEVYCSSLEQIVARLNYTSDIPCRGVEEVKSLGADGFALRIVSRRDPCEFGTLNPLESPASKYRLSARLRKPRITGGNVRLQPANVKWRFTDWLCAGAQRQHRGAFPPGIARSAGHCRGDLAGDRGGSGLHRIARQVRVARGGGRLGVAEHLADDRQAHSARRGDAGEGVPQIV